MQTTSDFRSDTLTKPTPEMREAMARAAVGDDVFGEDPTVRRLEAMTAALLGQEAGLFVPTGTMANQIAVKLYTQPGDEIIAERDCHILEYEVGGIGAISGVQARALVGKAGVLDAEEVEAAIRADDIHLPRTTLICIEQTHNVAGGAVIPLRELDRLREVSLRRGVPLHMDGARLLNAAAADRISPAEYGRRVDSVWIAFSKGLACPVGSVLCLPQSRLEPARRIRKLLGGGMRQVGILAAAGIVALETGLPQLGSDNALAHSLGERLSNLPRIHVDLATNRTNMMMVHFDDPIADAIEVELREFGVLALALKPKLLRFVTHREVGPSDVERAVDVLTTILARRYGAR
jgi:threonine aldolase